MTIPLCMDGRMLHQSGTGISTYARTLRFAQSRLARKTGTLVAPASRIPPWMGALGNHQRKAKQVFYPSETQYELRSSDLFRRAHIYFGWTGRLMQVQPDIPFGLMHWTYPVPLVMSGWLNIYTVHDAIPITHPSLSPVSGKRYMRTLRCIAQSSAAIVTISEASREELAKLDIFDSEKLTNARLAIDFPATSTSDPAKEIAAMGLKPKQYLLFVGSVEQRKNVERLLHAFRQSAHSMPLVIAGPPTPQGRDIENQIQATPNVIRLAYQPRNTLEALMEGAYALIFPSLAEGFGLPVVEAMAKGTAVVTSNIPAIAEIAGDAALLVDPYCVNNLADALNRIVADKQLVEKLCARGLRRSADYSIETFAGHLGRIYRTAIDTIPAHLPRAANS